MGWVIYIAPRSVSSSKVGLLPSLLLELQLFAKDENSFEPIDQIANSTLQFKITAPDEKVFRKKVNGYDIAFFKAKTNCKNYVLAQGAVAKRHLPKKETFAFQGIYYFVISDQKPTVMATNFLNDFFLIVSGECAKKDLASLVLQKTNIDEILSRPIP